MKRLWLLYTGFILALPYSCINGSASIQEEFDHELDLAVDNGDVKEAQWNNLLRVLEKSRRKGVRLKQGVATKQELVDFIWASFPNINGSAKDLIRPDFSIDTLNIYLENSSSMAGYFPKGGNPQFSAPIIDLYNVAGEKAVIQTFLAGETILSVDPHKFRSDLSNGEIAIGSSSPLADIMRTIIDALKPKQVSCLITDAIISGSNADIANNIEFNFANRATLRQSIREVFRTARQKQLSVSLYRFESRFKGTYFDYQNGKHKIDVSNRPFFIFFFGHLSSLDSIAQRAAKELAFKTSHELIIGKEIETITNFAFGPGQGQEYIADKSSKAISFSKPATRDCQVHIKVDLSTLPLFQRNSSYLNENLLLTTKDHHTNHMVDCSDFIDSVQEMNVQTGEFQINLFIPKDYLLKIPNRITVRLKGEQAPWFRELSLEKDNATHFQPDKTFALDYTVDGILMGLDAMELPDRVNFDIAIKQD